MRNHVIKSIVEVEEAIRTLAVAAPALNKGETEDNLANAQYYLQNALTDLRNLRDKIDAKQ